MRRVTYTPSERRFALRMLRRAAAMAERMKIPGSNQQILWAEMCQASWLKNQRGRRRATKK